MIQAEVDKPRNWLRVSYAGRIRPEETKRGVETLQRRLADLAPGFRLLTDLSGLEEMDVACERDMERMMDLCDEKGVEVVVRVIPDPQKDIGFNIMSLFHYGRRVRIITCKTLEEALQALADPGAPAQDKAADEHR